MLQYSSSFLLDLTNKTNEKLNKNLNTHIITFWRHYGKSYCQVNHDKRLFQVFIIFIYYNKPKLPHNLCKSIMGRKKKVDFRSYVKHWLMGSQSQTVVVKCVLFENTQTRTDCKSHTHTPLTSTEGKRERRRETVWPKARNIEPIRWQLSALLASVELCVIFMGALPLCGETWICCSVASVPLCFWRLAAVWLVMPSVSPWTPHLCYSEEDVNLLWYEASCLAAVRLH